MSPLLTEGTLSATTLAGTSGVRVVSADSPLTRLNYFDGKFLRADDLRLEQEYARRLVGLSNQGLGAGVAYGLDLSLDRQGGRLTLGPGLAFDGDGRTLLLPAATTLDVTRLIDASRRAIAPPRHAAPARAERSSRAASLAGAAFRDCVDVTDDDDGGVAQGTALYVICVGHAESLCGTEDVYGRLCEEACVTSTDRPYRVEGIVVRALPLTLRTPLATSRAVPLDRRHLRSLVASSYFADERLAVASLISGAGLRAETWCHAAQGAAPGCVPLGVLARAGAATIYFDAWTARRERIDAPARRYWAWRMAMRPWDAFLAHVLQFQCQLHEVLGAAPDDGGPDDPCAGSGQVLGDASRYLREVDDSYARHVDALSKLSGVPEGARLHAAFDLQGGVAALARLRERIDGAIRVVGAASRDRVLIDGGIVEAPSAGYLPVALGTVTVNEQVRRLMGPGVDLRFCVVRPDFVPHALEEAQHMERVSLIAGIDDPTARPEVDVLVPNGELVAQAPPDLDGWDAQLRVSTAAMAAVLAAGDASPDVDPATGAAIPRAAAAGRVLALRGAGRTERLERGGGAFHFAGALEADEPERVVSVLQGVHRFAAAQPAERETLAQAASAAPRADVELETYAAARVRDATVVSFAARAARTRAGRLGASVFETAAPAAPATTAVDAAAGDGAAAGWLTMRADRDLFALGAGESSPVSVELTVEVEGRVRAIFRARWFGTFVCTQPAVDAVGGRLVGGQVSGTYGVQALVNATAAPETGGAFELSATVLRGGTADAPTMRVRFSSAASRRLVYELDAKWGGTPMVVRATLRLGLDSATTTIASARLEANEEALREGSALRMLSTSAIALLGEGLTGAGQQGGAFADAALRTLFPPAPPPSRELTVRPTLDWVLFHRRRTKQCGAEERPAPTPARRYQVYHYLARTAREVTLVDRFLRAGAGAPSDRFQRVDVVEFAGGLAVLQTPVEAILRDWQQVHPGDTLLYGAIATAGASDTASLEDARLARLASALSSVSKVDPNASQLVSIPDVAPALAVPGTDGIVFLVTMTAARATCHDVWRAPNDPRVLALAETGEIAGLLALGGARRIGTATFAPGETDPAPNDVTTLASIWAGAGGSIPSAAIAFRNPAAGEGADDDATAAARAASIARALGGTANTTVRATVGRGTWPTQVTCPAVTVLIASRVSTVRVVVMAQGNAGVEMVAVTRQQRVPLRRDVVTLDDDALRRDAAADALLQELSALFAIGRIPIQTTMVGLLVPDAPTDEDRRQLDALVGALRGTTPPVVVDANLQAPPQLVQIATDEQKALLEEGGVPVDAVLVLVLRAVLR